MRMQLEGDPFSLHGLHQRGKERAAALRREQARRVLHAEVVHAHLHQLVRPLDVVGVGVDRRERVGPPAVDLHARFAAGLDRRLEVAVVVERVVDGEDVHAQAREHPGVEAHDIVREELEGVEALSPGERVDGRLQALAQVLHAAPGVFPQVAHAHVEDRAAQDVDGVVAHAVERGEDGRHHRRGHARGPQALVRIAQRHVDEPHATLPLLPPKGWGTRLKP